MKIMLEKFCCSYEIINNFYRKFCRQDDGVLWTPIVLKRVASDVSSAFDTSLWRKIPTGS